MVKVTVWDSALTDTTVKAAMKAVAKTSLKDILDEISSRSVETDEWLVRSPAVFEIFYTWSPHRVVVRQSVWGEGACGSFRGAGRRSARLHYHRESMETKQQAGHRPMPIRTHLTCGCGAGPEIEAST